MASDHLIPTPIVDKNGVVSIRYKKAQSSTSAVPVKSPTLSRQETHLPAMERLHEGLDDVFVSEGYNGMFALPDLLHRRLKSYDSCVVEAFDDAAMEGDSDERINYLGLLASCLNNDLSSDAAGYMLFSVKTTDFIYEWSDQHTADQSYVEAYRVYRGMQSMTDEGHLRELGWEMPANILEADEDDAARYRALLRLEMAVHDHLGEGLEWVNGEPYSYYSGYCLEDKNVYRHVLDNPDIADNIIALVEERDGLPNGLVDEMLNTPAASVREGVL